MMAFRYIPQYDYVVLGKVRGYPPWPGLVGTFSGTVIILSVHAPDLERRSVLRPLQCRQDASL